MLIMELNNIKKFYGDRLIIQVDDLKIYSNDRVGIVGLNGAGKTTLMEIMAGMLRPDEGTVKTYGECAYIPQFGGTAEGGVDPEIVREFGIEQMECFLSGGEKTRFKIARELSRNGQIIFADEPTCNLDIEGIELLEEKLKTFNGPVVLISHDRELLDRVCSKIIELEDGKIKIYPGNYSDYRVQKDMERERKAFEYEQYIGEKRRLTDALKDKMGKAVSMKKTPSRMGNSEARLHKMYAGNKAAKLERAGQTIKTRLEHLEKKERVKDIEKIELDIQKTDELHGRVVICGENISKKFNKRVIFNGSNLEIYNKSKTAIIGNNGTGKTTLINMILSGENGIKLSPAARIGYFSQSFDILDENRTVLENVMEGSEYPESSVRIVLARLLFKRDDVYKKVGVLSGGERVKASFARIFVSGTNMLILDEPTNFLDIYSEEALENVLKDYDGTLLFVSHDRRFIREIADTIITIEGGRITQYRCSYDEYLRACSRETFKENVNYKERLMLLENKLTEITSRISTTKSDKDRESLDKEYYKVLDEIRMVKSSINNKEGSYVRN